MKYLRSANLKNKTVLLRADFNVPVKEARVEDDFRLLATVPSIEKLRQQGCKIILCSHLGRPEKMDKAFTLRPVAERLAHILKLKFVETEARMPGFYTPHLVFVTGDIKKQDVREAIVNAPTKDIIFLENLRFYEEEEKNSAVFARNLADLGEAYINDAFAVSHRKDASIVAVTKYLPSFVGIGLEQELLHLSRILNQSKSPFVVMMGGIKISDKVKTIHNLSRNTDSILLGGGLANTIFLSRGYEVGLSKVESGSVSAAFELDHTLKNKLHLPVDVIVSNASMDRASIRVCAPFQVRKDELILDIGPKSVLQFSRILKSAKMLVWNGPLGYFEKKPFHHGTFALAKVVGAVSKGKCYGVVGGGETVDAVRAAGQTDYVDHLSTGGGAMLEFLAGNKLPGIEALE